MTGVTSQVKYINLLLCALFLQLHLPLCRSPCFLADNVDDSKKIEMFHSATHEQSKQQILADFSKYNSDCLCVVCTVAFAMGIYIKDIDCVINWGLSKSIFHY